MSREIEEVFLKLLNKIWKKGEILQEWNKRLINLIYKKGEKNDVKNCMGVILMNTDYKIYTGILNEKLKNEVGRKIEEGFKRKRHN
jgi:hypothetical protein